MELERESQPKVMWHHERVYYFFLFALCATLGIPHLEGVTHPSSLKRVTPPSPLLAPVTLETLCTKALVSDTPPPDHAVEGDPGTTLETPHT